MEAEKVPLKIPVPDVNGYLLKDVGKWAKNAYHKARIRVGWRKARKIKGIMPIEMADYAEKKTFGNWRLVAPAREGEKSPLQQALEALRPYIITNRWGQFRRGFVRLLKITFTAICESNYDAEMTAAMNEWLNDFLEGRRGPPVGRYGRQEGLPHAYLKSGVPAPHLEFVLLPETAEDRNSERLFNLKSGIWERFTGKPLDRAQYLDSRALPEQKLWQSGFKQMAMYLEVTL